MSETDKGAISDIAGKKSRSKNHGKHVAITKSGKTIKLNHTLKDRRIAKKDQKAREKAERMKDLPKTRIKRFFFHLRPKRVFKYWFSKRGLFMGLKITGIGLVCGFLLLVGVFAYFRKDLPNLKDIYGSNLGGSIKYYDKTGQTMLWEDYDENLCLTKRNVIKDTEISQFSKDAMVAVEDREFYNHGGYNAKGIIRATLNNASGGDTQGGSTITQQLVKLTTPGYSKNRTPAIKIKELILSVEMERSYSKNEILAGYLNAAPFGGIEYGVEAASEDYFRKPAGQLTLDEAAFLASIPKAPGTYSPYSTYFKKDKLKARQDYTLDIMADMGKITAKQRDDAKKIDTVAKVQPRKNAYDGIQAPYFVLRAKAELVDKYGLDKNKVIGDDGVKECKTRVGGWKVITSLDLDLQKEAEKEIIDGTKRVGSLLSLRHPVTGVYNADAKNGAKAAITAEDVKTGQIVAMVGGTDFFDAAHGGQTNFAHERLAPGSSIKPYDYISLLESTTNSGAGSVLFDTKGKLGDYACTKPGLGRTTVGADCLYDYDSRFPGPLTIRYALGGSRNVPAVKAFEIAGQQKVRDTMKSLGLSSGYNCEDRKIYGKSCPSSSGIGDGAYLYQDEHVHGYATIARNGLNIPQTTIVKIDDTRGKTIYEWKLVKGEQAVREDSAFIVGDILMDGNASYFPASLKPHAGINGNKFGMKTGSTANNKDGWMMGFSTHYAVGVWVGEYSGEYEFAERVTMEQMTLPIWNGFMRYANKNKPAETRPKPAGVQELPAYIVRAHVGIGSVEPTRATDYFPSWYQKPAKKTASKQIIDTVSNKIATDCTPARAKKEIFDSSAESLSSDTLSGSANITEKDDIHKCTDTKPSVSLAAPTNIGAGKYHLSATITQGTFPLSGKFKGQLIFKIDGQVIQTLEANAPGLYEIDYASTMDGDHTFAVDVVDSVLYDGTDQQSANITSSVVSFNPNYDDTSKKLVWNMRPSITYTLRYNKNTSAYTKTFVASPITMTSGSYGVGSYTGVEIEDSEGNKSAPISFIVTP